uniref:Uncharacterized protein n=1 Tax=Oryza sativa subsp. japonica TaxID=39947 RepID=Q8LHV1_ORYSJ|nr:hypothetical protein [Oryza sativa Japonica Group]
MATATVTVEEMKRRRRQPSGLDAARAFLAGAGRDGLVCVVSVWPLPGATTFGRRELCDRGYHWHGAEGGKVARRRQNGLVARCDASNGIVEESAVALLGGELRLLMVVAAKCAGVYFLGGVKTMSWLPETGGSDALCVVSFLEASSRRSPVLFL